MTNWKTYQDKIIQELATVLEPKGFEWIANLSQFRKTTDKGFLNYLLSFSSYPDALIVEAHAGVRINAVEEMAFPFTNGLKTFQPDSNTVISSLGRLKGKRFERHLVASLEDVRKFLMAMKEDLKEWVEPFWEKYHHLQSLHQLFNYPKEDQLLLVTNWNYAPLRGIVLAKLLNSSDFPALLLKHREVLKELVAHDLLKERFEQLAIYLQEMSFN
jgi:(p)ppGpp synthase/HD superfamily hydrolase